MPIIRRTRLYLTLHVVVPANVPAPHNHSQQNQAPPHAVLNTVLFS